MRTLSPEIFPTHVWSFCLSPVPHSLKRFIKAIMGFGGIERIGLPGTSPVVQWLRLHASKPGDYSSIPGWGTNFPHALVAWKKKKGLPSRISSVQLSHSVVSDSLRPHESQHARPPCPSPTPGVHSDSHPLSQWCHPAIWWLSPASDFLRILEYCVCDLRYTKLLIPLGYKRKDSNIP